MALYLGKDLISGGGSGGSTTAIIDVDSLPTENINANAFYRVGTPITWDGVVGNKPVVDLGDFLGVLVSDRVFSAEDVVGSTLTTNKGISIVGDASTITAFDGGIMFPDAGMISVSNVDLASASIGTEFPSIGTYFMYVEAQSLYAQSLTFATSGLFAYNGTEWVEYVTKSQLDEAKLDPTNLNGWCLEPGKISATTWDEYESQLSISTYGIEINHAGTTDTYQFPGTLGTAVTLATKKDIERVDANGEEIANYCLGLNTRLESVETFISTLINATEVAL